MSQRPRVDITSVTRLTEVADYIVPFAIRVVCALGVADHLVSGPRPVAELAAATGAHPGALARLLRALAGRGVFAEVDDGQFALTPLAEPLREDHPMSLRAAYPLVDADVRTLGRLVACLRTGAPSFPQVHGCDYWTYLAAHPDDSRAVDRWGESLNRIHLRTVLPALDWSGAASVVDVGGGNGAFLAGVLRRQPRLNGVLLDLPHVVDAAPALLALAGVAARCEVVAGSFFDPLPGGADRYVLKTVLPGWDDERAGAILRGIRAAMHSGSRLLLLEAIIPAGDGYDVAKLVDVHTMALTGGRHRSREELAALLAGADLHLVAVTPTPTLTVVQAVPR